MAKKKRRNESRRTSTGSLESAFRLTAVSWSGTRKEWMTS